MAGLARSRMLRYGQERPTTRPAARKGVRQRTSAPPSLWGVLRYNQLYRDSRAAWPLRCVTIQSFVSSQEGGLVVGGEPRYKFCIVAEGAALCRDTTRDTAAIRRRRHVTRRFVQRHGERGTARDTAGCAL